MDARILYFGGEKGWVLDFGSEESLKGTPATLAGRMTAFQDRKRRQIGSASHAVTLELSAESL